MLVSWFLPQGVINFSKIVVARFIICEVFVENLKYRFSEQAINEQKIELG